jgi:alpha-1,3-fucosyltransferase 10
VTRDRRRLREADAVVVHVPTLHRPWLPRRRPGQLRVAWCKESEQHYPRLRDPAFLARFDLTMSHRQDADVFDPYLPTRAEIDAARGREPEPRLPGRIAAAFISSRFDRSGRIAYLRELMRHVEVDSFGRRLRTSRLPHDRGGPTKLGTIARYPFTIAFENAVSTDYVTEKFYDPLLAGSVPVVLGAPNVDEFAPGNGCFLDVRDFVGPAALAARLRELAADADSYRELLAWRARPLQASFLRLLDRREPPLTALYRLLVDRLGRAPTSSA